MLVRLLSAVRVLLVVSGGSVALLSGAGLAVDPFWGADPGWSRIHEPAVERGTLAVACPAP
jgi:hypothetical protein